MIPQYTPTLHELTKNDEEPISFTPVRNEADCPAHQQSQDLLYLCGELSRLADG